MAIKTRHSGVTHAMGGCYDCGGTDAKWHGRNAVACAANHARHTSHHTWAEQVIAVSYNRKDRAMAARGNHDSGPGAREIAQMLNAQAEALAFVLFPNAVKAGGLIHIGSVRGEPGDSLKIHYRGDKAGRWADYSVSQGDPDGMGDMLKLVQRSIAPPLADQHPLANAVKWAKGWLGIESMDPAVLERQKVRAAAAARRAEAMAAEEIDKSRSKARGLWLSAAPIIGTPAMKYLEGRGIDFALLERIPGVLRYRHDVWQPDYGRPCPALLTAGIGSDGTHWCTHATYLDRAGNGDWVKLPEIEKADPQTGELRKVKCAKKIFGRDWLGTFFPIHRGQSRKPLAAMPAGEAPYLAEGLEDALTAAMIDPARRVLMAGTLGNVGRVWLPDQCRGVVLVAQRDTKAKAIENTEAQIAALQARGLSVKALWPAEGFKDINDELRGIRA